jgi:glutamine synthetase
MPVEGIMPKGSGARTEAEVRTALATVAKAEKSGIRTVQLQFVDLHGIVKSVQIPIHQMPNSIKHGTWFDGSSVEGFTRIAESDQLLRPDMSTWRVLPWAPAESGAGTARVICDVLLPDGSPFAGDPRGVLRRQVERAEKLGYKVNMGPELEFFLFENGPDGRPIAKPHDKAGYFDFTGDQGITIRQDMVDALEMLGIKIETAHHEVAPGQHEIDFEYSDSLATADNATTFKYALKEIASQHGLYASFMPKPIFGINGSGMHTHQSLASLKTGKNVFYDAKDKYGLSPIAKSYMAGTLKHARAMIAILAPTVNSYKRLVPGYEAPTYLVWGRKNRSALIRVPMISAGRSVEATRMELRCPDPSANPYLAFAVMIAAGLDGVEKGLTLPDPVEESLYEMDAVRVAQQGIRELPGSLAEAIEELKDDPVVCGALGEPVLSHFLEAKQAEWDAYRTHVTDWEVERYLELY